MTYYFVAVVSFSIYICPNTSESAMGLMVSDDRIQVQ